MTDLTVPIIAEAIRKNGLPQKTDGDYYTWKDAIGGDIVAACALGQAAINLDERNVPYSMAGNILDFLNGWTPTREEAIYCDEHETHAKLGWYITHLNDVHHSTFEEIGNWLDNWWTSRD